MTVAHYLARLAAEAVNVINAADYGRAIYDLATRRALITVGEDMVNIAYDAPVDMSPSDQIEDAERRLFELAETGRYDGGFESFTDAVKTAVDMANAAFMRDGHLSGIATGMRDLDRPHGRPAALRPDRARRPPRHGQDLARHQHRLQHRACLRAGAAGRRLVQGQEWRRHRLLLARNVVRAARHPHHLGADGNPLVEDPARRDHRDGFRKARRLLADHAEDPAVHRPDRRHLDRAARGARAAAEAPARPRRHRHRLYPADAGFVAHARRRTACRKSPRSPPASRRSARSSACRSSRCRSSRVRSKAATTSARSSRTCANRARSSRTPTWCCSSTARNITSGTRSRSPARSNTCSGKTEMNEARGKAEVIIAKQRHGPTGTVSASPSRANSPASPTSPRTSSAGAV